jgi:hypothetical protein
MFFDEGNRIVDNKWQEVGRRVLLLHRLRHWTYLSRTSSLLVGLRMDIFLGL